MWIVWGDLSTTKSLEIATIFSYTPSYPLYPQLKSQYKILKISVKHEYVFCSMCKKIENNSLK